MKITHDKPRAFDDIGRLQVPQYLRDILKVDKDDEFQLTVDVKRKAIVFEHKEKGVDESIE